MKAQLQLLKQVDQPSKLKNRETLPSTNSNTN